MTNEDDKVTIGGTFATRSTVNHSNLLTAGTIEIDGDLYQYRNNDYNFHTSGTHKVVLNGTKKQTVSFESRDDGNHARFNILEITNKSEDGVYFATTVWVQNRLHDTDSVVKGSARLYLSSEGVLADNVWSNDLRINQNKTLNSDWSIGGSLYLTGGTFDLNGRKLNVEKDIAVDGGTLVINGGQVDVGRDLRIQEIYTQNDGTITYNDYYTYGKLKMTNENDFVKVNRNFVMYSNYNHNELLTNGILEIKGNFNQYSGSERNFSATGDHRVVLSGTEKQTISLSSPNARFANLEITNTFFGGIVGIFAMCLCQAAGQADRMNCTDHDE